MKKKTSPILFIFILIAAVLWYGNKLGKRFVTEITIPMHLENDYAARMWISAPDIDIQCQVEGAGIRLLAYRWGVADRVKIPISYLVGRSPVSDSTTMPDADEVHATAYYVGRSAITSSLVQAATDLRIIHVMDSSITLDVWPIASKLMPIKSNIELSTAPQYMQLGEINFSPCSVMVRGPLPVLDTMICIHTHIRKLTGINSSKTGRIEILAPTEVELKQKAVDYRIEITPYTQQQITLPIRTVGVPEGLSAMTVPSSVELSLNVPLELFDHIRPERIHASIRYSPSTQSSMGRYIVAIDSLLPGVEVMKITPAEVELFTSTKH